MRDWNRSSVDWSANLPGRATHAKRGDGATLCGQRVSVVRVTNETARVNCKTCRRALARRERHGDR
jgi:hypothetical protein